MTNIKNKTIACSLVRLNCYSPEGALRKDLNVNIGHFSGVKELADLDLLSRDVYNTGAPKTVVVKEVGQIHIDGLNCKAHEVVNGQISVTAGVPPKFLNAAHKAAKYAGSASKSGYDAGKGGR